MLLLAGQRVPADSLIGGPRYRFNRHPPSLSIWLPPLLRSFSVVTLREHSFRSAYKTALQQRVAGVSNAGRPLRSDPAALSVPQSSSQATRLFFQDTFCRHPSVILDVALVGRRDAGQLGEFTQSPPALHVSIPNHCSQRFVCVRQVRTA